LGNKLIIPSLMRTLKTILVIASLILLSCEKSEFNANVTGDWNIYGSGGGIFGQGSTYSFDYMSLKVGNDYIFVRNDTIIEKGTYRFLDYESNIFTGEYSIRFNQKIQLNGGAHQITDHEMIVNLITTDTLSLCENMIDGFCYYFAKE